MPGSTQNQNFALLDYALIIPGAVGSLVTGFWICETTNWGFTRYRWVIAKWVGTLSGILIGTGSFHNVRAARVWYGQYDR
ncbi:MAG: hypothetical protein M1281_13485 [Chloroflexi bacterium]|nr:hypothetical protein [Chloroflexota bacterium]